MMSRMKILMIHTELCLQALLWERLFYIWEMEKTEELCYHI